VFLCQQQSNCGHRGDLRPIESGPRVLPHSRWVVECGRHAPPCTCPVAIHSPSTDCSLTHSPHSSQRGCTGRARYWNTSSDQTTRVRSGL
jgi:hypothetical protein